MFNFGQFRHNGGRLRVTGIPGLRLGALSGSVISGPRIPGISQPESSNLKSEDLRFQNRVSELRTHAANKESKQSLQSAPARRSAHSPNSCYVATRVSLPPTAKSRLSIELAPLLNSSLQLVVALRPLLQHKNRFSFRD